MMRSFEQTILINASANAVWDSLTQSNLMKEWMGESEMSIEVETDWTVGGPIVVRGFHHVPFENTGTVLEFEPTARLAYTHLSSLSRLPDAPNNYTTLEFALKRIGDTVISYLCGDRFSFGCHLQAFAVLLDRNIGNPEVVCGTTLSP